MFVRVVFMHADVEFHIFFVGFLYFALASCCVCGMYVYVCVFSHHVSICKWRPYESSHAWNDNVVSSELSATVYSVLCAIFSAAIVLYRAVLLCVTRISGGPSANCGANRHHIDINNKKHNNNKKYNNNNNKTCTITLTHRQYEPRMVEQNKSEVTMQTDNGLSIEARLAWTVGLSSFSLSLSLFVLFR